ncbi:type II secretion system F family protein [Lachnotalea sp. AF33-28]|uniref:type II secretion system F family protein n=1 Tax=Lachnotalea sp. AF33-28 TaxID=2292046 RepID=UPI001FAA1400|nr:type II secretion system F family protein [Lachnotalea sp. AF33-28]
MVFQLHYLKEVNGLALYKYTAKAENGKSVRGMAEAADENELYEKLRAGGQFLITSSLKQDARSVRKMKPAQLSDFCRQLGTLLGAGVSLVRALNIIAQDQNLKPGPKKVYEDVLRLIRQGIPLSDAMEQQQGAFPELLINMIRSAEASGSLDQTSKRMAEHFDKDHRLNSKVKNAMVYPAILICMIIVVLIFVVVYIIPQFADIFASLEELPLPTVVVLGISDALTNHWPVILAAVAAAAVFFSVVFRIPDVALQKDRMKLKIPVIGKLLKVVYTARFARTLSSLYSSGIPIVTALQIGKHTVGNKYIESQFDEVIYSVRTGESLSKSLAAVDGFVNKLASSIMVGEETGSLDEMLNVIADALEYDSEMAIARMTAMLEPVLIIVMGVIIGFVIIAVMMPVFDGYSTIENGANY